MGELDTRLVAFALENIQATQKTLAEGLQAHSAEMRQSMGALDVRLSSFDHRITVVEAALNEGVKPRLDKVEETTGTHNLQAILSKGKRSSRPPLLKALNAELAKGIAKALGLLLAGWLAHHVLQPPTSHAAPPPASSSARP